jgi:putative membrane protein
MGMGMMTFGLLMMLSGLAVLVVIVVVGFWAVIHFTGPGRQGGSGSDPREILDQRFARGEIDQEEYQRIRRQLG